MEKPRRYPWDHFPDVLIHAPEQFIKSHHAYSAALRGHLITQGAHVIGATVLARIFPQVWHRHRRSLMSLGENMATSKTGGTGVLDSTSIASALPKPDIFAELHRAKESLRTWKRWVDEGRVESLFVQLPALPQDDNHVRMLSSQEREQLRATKMAASAYAQHILHTTPIK